MIRKRRSLSSSRSPKETPPVSRARQVTPPLKRRVISPTLREEPLKAYAVPTTRDTKRELILTHVHARRAQGVKPEARFWLIFTVLATALVVLGGWWVTFGKSIQDVSLRSDGLLQMVGERSQDLKQEVGSPVEGMQQQLERYQVQQASQAALLRQMMAEATNRQATGTATGTR